MIDAELIIPPKKKLPKNLRDKVYATPSITIVNGQTGSGKSTVTFSLLKHLQDLHKGFDHALFVTGNNRDPLLDALDMPVTSSPKDLEDFITTLKNAEEGTKNVLVLDDIQGHPSFNIFSPRSQFTSLMLNHRHYGESKKKPHQFGTWIILTSQSIKSSFAPAVRNQVKNWFMFYPNRQPQTVTDYELIAQDPDKMKKAMAFLKTQGKHNFLYLNKNDPEEDKYFLGFKKELTDLV